MAKFGHFDLKAKDAARARGFYESVFNWKFHRWDGPMEYWLIQTGAGKYGIDGGMSLRNESDKSNVTFTAAVPDVDAYLERALSAGASQLLDKHTIPGVGDMVLVADREGLPFGMLQFLPGAEGQAMPGAPAEGRRPVHFEFCATDVEAAMKFYTAVLDWTFDKHGGEQTYYLAKGGDQDAPGINGGLMPEIENCPNMFLAVIETPDVEATAGAITAAGGSLVTARMDIPHVGSCYYCTDTECNSLAIMQFTR
ncbi:MAG: hypothetical protein KGJ62_10020 [Armatimonadetes bacterium]|nr:hypothetical protein [Armatimonadota bacterium]MDE2206685.1 hypothetical protein [Armatimonadota bacterium]